MKTARDSGRLPKERVRCGKVSLLMWENLSKDGEAFNSFSLNKRVIRFDKDDRSKFSGQRMSLNGLTWKDLVSIKQAISEIEDKRLGVDDLGGGD